MDPLDTVFEERATVVAERDALREEALVVEEISKQAAGTFIGDLGGVFGGAAKMLADWAPYLYIGLPAAAGVGAGALAADALGPGKEDVDLAAARVLKAKNRLAAADLAQLVEEEGSHILDGPSESGRAVRLA